MYMEVRDNLRLFRSSSLVDSGHRPRVCSCHHSRYIYEDANIDNFYLLRVSVVYLILE